MLRKIDLPQQSGGVVKSVACNRCNCLVVELKAQVDWIRSCFIVLRLSYSETDYSIELGRLVAVGQSSYFEIEGCLSMIENTE